MVLKMAHILISGFDGYVNKYDSGVRSYEVIPLSWVSSTNYYEVTDSEIIHHLTYNISANNPDNFTSYALGPKPSMLETGYLLQLRWKLFLYRFKDNVTGLSCWSSYQCG